LKIVESVQDKYSLAAKHRQFKQFKNQINSVVDDSSMAMQIATPKRGSTIKYGKGTEVNKIDKSTERSKELSYHGDPCDNHRFRILQNHEKFPAWHPDRFWDEQLNPDK
jgi:hypothetical protein